MKQFLNGKRARVALLVLSALLLGACRESNEDVVMVEDGTVEITATDVPRKVMFRLPGKQYRASGEQDAGYPFEEEIVQPGSTLVLPAGSEFIRVVDMGVDR